MSLVNTFCLALSLCNFRNGNSRDTNERRTNCKLLKICSSVSAPYFTGKTLHLSVCILYTVILQMTHFEENTKNIKFSFPKNLKCLLSERFWHVSPVVHAAWNMLISLRLTLHYRDDEDHDNDVATFFKLMPGNLG